MLFKKTVWKNEQKQAELKQSEPSEEQISLHGCFLQMASPHVQGVN